jgi:hypothetical protein
MLVVAYVKQTYIMEHLDNWTKWKTAFILMLQLQQYAPKHTCIYSFIITDVSVE